MVDESVFERRLNGDEDPKDLPLALLQQITENFSEERKIGQGGFGAVYKGVLQNGIIVAVKRIDVSVHTIDDKLFRREFNSLRKINHQNVVRFLGFCSNSYQTPIEEPGSEEINLASVRERLLCFEYINNGSLDNHITDELRGLEWEMRYNIISGICKGLCHLKEKNIIHMDLKPTNILLDDHMVPKITDFGLSRPNENSHTMGLRFGTLGYFAPEYLNNGETTFECDIYSLGVIILELVTGRKGVPDYINNVLRRWRHRWNKPPTILQYQQVSRCIEIAVRCRKQEPKDRPSIGDIISFLRKSESTDGHTGQENTYLDDDMLGIQPLELHVTFRLNKEMSWLVKLTNRTKACFAFIIKISSKQYTIRPDKGIVPPGCNEYLVQIAMQQQEKDPQVTQEADKFVVQSTKVSEVLRVEDITEHIFHEKAGQVVDEVDLMVVYEPTKHQENPKSREESSMPVGEVPEAKRRKIEESAFEMTKHGRIHEVEATSMDINSSARGHCVGQTEWHNLHPLQCFSRHYPTNKTYLGEGSRAVDVARGAMGSLLDKLGKLVKEDYNLERSVQRDIVSLSEDLAIIHKDLPYLEKLDGVMIWLAEVRELSYNFEDMVDSFLVYVEPDSNRSGFKELPHEGLKFLSNNMMIHHQIADVIKDIKNQVQIVVGKQKKYNFNANNVIANATIKAPMDPRMGISIKKGQLIGIEGQTDELIRLFEEDGDVLEEELKIVSIVGLGGLGKTTLAKEVYGKLKEQYHCRAFVSVGQNPDVKKVMLNILYAFGNKSFADSDMELQQLIEKLQVFLEDKRYLIVIDDIWDSEAWGPIQSAFPENSLGSRVITTTRIHRVALATCNAESKFVYRMKPLSDEDSRRLFLRRIFGPGKNCPDALKDISADILKRCGGMPLAIISIASLLAGEPASTWDYVTKTLGAMTEEDGLEKMKQILDLSYTHLPSHLKTCLLYVCLYPEDREIDKTDLLRKWVAEGFVHTSGRNGGLAAEDVAEKYFKDLINMCMIQPEEMDYNNEVVSCRVHDIILDLMRSKSRKENFIHVIDGSKDETGQIRRVSVHYSDQEYTRILETIDKASFSHVRSVLLYQTSDVDWFFDFKYVRVLHLELDSVCTNGIDLTDISMLVLLRYLKVIYFDYFFQKGGVRVYDLKLPNQIGGLQQLETIEIHGVWLKNIPSDIVSLPRLLHLKEVGYGIVLPDGIGRLKSLRTLVGVCFGESDAHSVENIIGLGKLTNLRELGICLMEYCQSMVEEIMRTDALHTSICMLAANLEILTLESSCGIILDARGWSSSLFPVGCRIQELNLLCCSFQSCPECIGQLHHLYKFHIRVREVADSINTVAGLHSLAYFELNTSTHSGHSGHLKCKPWQVIASEEKEESVVIPGGGSFQGLKCLLFHCPKVSLTFETGAMPKLEKLDIRFYHSMPPHFFPVGIQHLPAPTLKYILVRVVSNDRALKGSKYWDDQDWNSYFSSPCQLNNQDWNGLRMGTQFMFEIELHHPGADINLKMEYDESTYADVEGHDDYEDYKGADEEDDEGVDEEDYYSEEDDDASYQVNGSQTSAQVQAKIRQLVQVIEAHQDSGRKSINTDALPMEDMSPHLAVRLPGWQSRRDQAFVISEALRLTFTAPLAPWPSPLHLTPYSLPNMAERMANFDFDINYDLSVEQGNHDSMLVNEDLPDFPPCGLVDLIEAPNEDLPNNLQMELSTIITNFPVDINNDFLVQHGNNGMLVNAVGQNHYFPLGELVDPIQAPNQLNDEEFLEVNDVMMVAELIDLINQFLQV